MSTTIKKEIYPVTEMSCASCALQVEQHLQKQPGIVRASVQYASQEAQIEFDPTIIQPEAIQSTVQSIGYNLILPSTTEIPTIEDPFKRSYRTTKQNLIGASILTLPIFFLGMFFMHHPYSMMLQLVFSTPVIFYYGRRFFEHAEKQLLSGYSSMDTLIALSTGTAYVYSSILTIRYILIPHSSHTVPSVYFESAAVVITFVLLGKWLEARAKTQTGAALRALIGLQPDTAYLWSENEVSQPIPIASIQSGNLLLIKPGSYLPVDGKVISGTSYVNESSITGEPLPVLKSSGDTVYAGTLNQEGSMCIRAEQVGSTTLLSQIIQRVKEAQSSKAPIEKKVNILSSYFVPVILFISLITLLGWGLVGGEDGWSKGFYFMITVLVVACPCALGLATPTALMVGIGKGARQGILIKDAESLERAHALNILVVDKTGTLTEGKPHVVDSWFTGNEELYTSILYGIEEQSTHPLAQAVVQFATLKNSTPLRPDTIETIPGKGIQAYYQQDTFSLGSSVFLKNTSLSSDLVDLLKTWNEKGYTIVVLVEHNICVAALAISDTLKPHAPIVVKQLEQEGIEVHMLTGDSRSSAQSIADLVGIKNVWAEQLPGDKEDYIKRLQAQGKVVGMVGDGINDSQALAQADVSIAMGEGSDLAIDVAQMTLLPADLKKLPKAVLLSKQTIQIVYQNLFWAFLYNIIAIPIAAGWLYPWTGWQLNPMIAGGAMALSSISVILNSLRLNYKKLN
ncbi:MAG: cadmium-translocating P-type ATPase [Cytophagaceae bacterium]|jgi:Cu2+-exporting ATPase|nr:cadmium-translocating P-type ATPase [Cytophagaceae bacterium]